MHKAPAAASAKPVEIIATTQEPFQGSAARKKRAIDNSPKEEPKQFSSPKLESDKALRLIKEKSRKGSIQKDLLNRQHSPQVSISQK